MHFFRLVRVEVAIIYSSKQMISLIRLLHLRIINLIHLLHLRTLLQSVSNQWSTQHRRITASINNEVRYMWECCYFSLSLNFSILCMRERCLDCISFNKCFVDGSMFLCFIYLHSCEMVRLGSSENAKFVKRADDIYSRDDVTE